jgi:DNA modification methylase
MLYKKTENYTLFQGSNLDVLPTLPDNSVDAIVTDPPYEIGFMGKGWDSSGIAFNVELWKECLRVLKPGGHVLAFGATRTFHRLAVAVEDAGFEIRDSIAWLYGSGFPKSMDVSKAIDKGSGENRERQLRFTSWMRSTGITSGQIDAATGTSMGGHYLTDASQPAIATADLFDLLRPLLPEVPEEIERLVAERTGIEWTAYKNRPVIGAKMSGISNKDEEKRHTIGAGKAVAVEITAAATPEAEEWKGWGTALKPAFEPVVVGRKPLIGTVARNVLTYGTGALNIDATRIKVEGEVFEEFESNEVPLIEIESDSQPLEFTKESETLGRWPSNVIFDEFTAEILDEQSGVTVSKAASRGLMNSGSLGGIADTGPTPKPGTNGVRGHDDSGGASRFFYVAKPSSADRNEGLDHLPLRKSDTRSETAAGLWSKMEAPKRNFHPTVKPTDLLRYLVKLVTPPNGVVLDVFNGSGSTGKAALLEGFKYIGIELTEEYLPLTEARLDFIESKRANEEANSLF